MPPKKHTRRPPPDPLRPKRRAPQRSANSNGSGSRPYRAAETKRRRGRTMAVLYAMLIGIGAAALLTSPKLSVKRVAVRGAEGLPPIEAQAVAQSAFLPPGVNEFLAPTGKLEAKLKNLPCVHSANVSRRFPDGLQADVVLRQSVATAQTDAGDFEVDRTGVAIRAARPEMIAGLPHIALLRSRPVVIGASFNDTALDAALEALEKAATAPYLHIAKLEVDLSDNLCLNMQDGIKVRFGAPEDIAKKIGLLAAAYRQEPTLASRLLAINLSCPEWPACTPRKTAAAPPATAQATKTPG